MTDQRDYNATSDQTQIHQVVKDMPAKMQVFVSTLIGQLGQALRDIEALKKAVAELKQKQRGDDRLGVSGSD